jgi:GGDEF domain-containing protein
MGTAPKSLTFRHEPVALMESAQRATDAVSVCELFSDPLFAVAMLRGKVRLGLHADHADILARWAAGVTRESGAARYRWAIDPRLGTEWPAWVGPQSSWRPWRARDKAAWAERAQRSIEDIERLLTPLIITDSLQLLVDAARRSGASGHAAEGFLDEALPKARRDAARWVLESRAWADTWALWAIARRPAALNLLLPFASAIADSYAASASRTGNVVLGTRFPYHDSPLVSASAQLAVGLVALGVHPNLAGDLTTWVRAQHHDDGGWGDGDGVSDLLTTYVAAELLLQLDPAYDPGRTASWFASVQRDDGWWRACGPEATWLTVEILDWLARAQRPFAQRFIWPHAAVTNRDRRTGLPFYGYFADLERVFAAIPSLADASIELAFIDLAGFGTYNNAFGMEEGDKVLRTFAQALTRIPDSVAIRDGGDEFIVLGTPTGSGLPASMAAFREAWAIEFAAAYGHGVVAPRVLTATTFGAGIVEARNRLGVRIAQVKHDIESVGAQGVQVDLAIE